MVLVGLIIMAGFLVGNSDALELGKTKTTGTAAIGQDFVLTSHKGEQFDTATLRGKYMLVFFGFTHCQGICPTGLNNITIALDKIGDKISNIVPLFITIDAKRDNASRMAEHLANFHEKIIGLTGSEDEVKLAADAYKVYYSEHKADAGEADYDVDHSAFIYLMNKNGEYLAHFSYNIDGDELAQKISALMK